MKSRVLAFTPTRAATPARRKLLEQTVKEGINSAGIKFDWHVYFNGVQGIPLKGVEAFYYDENMGQHCVWNVVYAHAKEAQYDYLLRIDDDCGFLSHRWLKKLVDCSHKLADRMILAPTVRGLKNPPERSEPAPVGGIILEFLKEAIGGVCRLHPMPLLADYTADIRWAMGAGDATGIGNHCIKHCIPMVYVKHIRVRHSTLRQELEDPEHFLNHSLCQTIPYIPTWTK